jgi:hypothetical protein
VESFFKPFGLFISMKKYVFIISILGISVLLILLIFFPKEIEKRSIEDMEINEKIIFEGKIENERNFGDFRILNIDGLDIICDCKESYLGKHVEIVGLIDEYNGNKQIKVLKIAEINKLK